MFKESKQELKVEVWPTLAPEEAIELLQNEPSRLEKERILRSCNEEFFQGVNWVGTKLITFGVANVPLSDDSAPTTDKVNWADFQVLLTKLMNRELTGSAAQNEIDYVRRHTSKDRWNNWYQRILAKDLRCGMSATTSNKVIEKSLPEYTHLLVKNFGCQLADHINTIDGIRLGTYRDDSVYVEMKLNGVRLLTFVYPETKTVIQLSRNGDQKENFKVITDTLAGVLDQFNTKEPFVLDGEIMSASFNALMTQVNRKKDVDTKDCVYHVFDIVPLKEFNNGISTKGFAQRLSVLADVQNILDKGGVRCVRTIKSHFIDLKDEKSFDSLENLRLRAFEAGFEGLVFKAPTMLYRSTGKQSTDRNDGWLAYKPTLTVSLTAKEMYEGTGAIVGMMGGVTCTGQEGDKKITVDVGGGFSLAQRKDFWVNKDKVLGQVLEIKCDEITKNKDNDLWSLRFPRFVGFRGFDKGEKM